MKHPDYEFASSYKDRHGKTRWRIRRKGLTKSLPGEPHTPEFDYVYSNTLNNNSVEPATLRQIKRGVYPKTFGHAWELVKQTIEWKALADSSKYNSSRLAEEFLSAKISETSEMLWKNAPVEDLKRRHVKRILSERIETPHKAKHVLTEIRRIIDVAFDEEWIENDPTQRIKWRPKYKGWRAWTEVEMKQYITRWPIGTTPYLVFCLALLLGDRRSDVANVKWSNRQTRSLEIDGQARIVRGFHFKQKKTGKELFLPELPMLSEALEATERTGETILVTQYGKPFSDKSLTGRMGDWTRSAGMVKGCTMHGLRKTLGKMVTEGGGTTKQSMSVLGHDNLAEAELYSIEADQARLAVQGMDRAAAAISRLKP